MRNAVRHVGRRAAGGEQFPLRTHARHVLLKLRASSPQLPEPNRKIQLLESSLSRRKQTSGVNPNREFSRFEFPFSIFGALSGAHFCSSPATLHLLLPPTRKWLSSRNACKSLKANDWCASYPQMKPTTRSGSSSRASIASRGTPLSSTGVPL